MNRLMIPITVVVGVLLAGVLVMTGYLVHRPATVVRTVTVVHTITKTVKVPEVKTVVKWKTRTVQAASAAPAPQPSYSMPPGVKAGPRPGTYYVDCFSAQCTSLPDAGPNGTTCGQVSTGEQLCQ